MTSQQAKQRLYDIGADLVDIARMDRFDGVPQGCYPADVLQGCRSVIVFAKRFLRAALDCNTTVPYTSVRNLLSSIMNVCCGEVIIRCNRYPTVCPMCFCASPK